MLLFINKLRCNASRHLAKSIGVSLPRCRNGNPKLNDKPSATKQIRNIIRFR